MKKYWFKPKTYGYGVMPISWEGWIVVIMFVGVLGISAHINYIIPYRANTLELFRFCLDVTIFTAIFLLFTRDKIDGKLGWRWGKKKWF